MPLFKFKHDEEAIKLANDTIYGLAAYFFTRVSSQLSPTFELAVCDAGRRGWDEKGVVADLGVGERRGGGVQGFMQASSDAGQAE